MRKGGETAERAKQQDKAKNRKQSKQSKQTILIFQAKKLDTATDLCYSTTVSSFLVDRKYRRDIRKARLKSKVEI